MRALLGIVCRDLSSWRLLQATTLRLLCAVSDSMGTLLREAEAQIMKSCDTDLLGCGTSNPVNHFLDRAPRVFTLQVAWESDNETPEAISGTLAALDEEVRQR